MNFANKFQAYEYYLRLLNSTGLDVSDYREINYGLQFKVGFLGSEEVLRIYESKKKGVRLDTSQVKNKELLDILSNGTSKSEKRSSYSTKAELRFGGREKGDFYSDRDSSCLIGTDESGKGDYFGPLVIAGVYADKKEKEILRELGVEDSKRLKDMQISRLAKDIKILCKHDIVVIGNCKYNELYESIGNLNKLLAWGHARVIENMLSKVDCPLVLSDQFGNKLLIEDALMARGKKVILEQRPRAEENIVVAAASILARDEFVSRLSAMSKKYGIKFPKGASPAVKLAGSKYMVKYGKDALAEVAKLHFKTTDQI